MEEKAVSAEAVRATSYGGVGHAGLAGDLAQAGAGNEAVEDGFEEVASAEPVARGEGL